MGGFGKSLGKVWGGFWKDLGPLGRSWGHLKRSNDLWACFAFFFFVFGLFLFIFGLFSTIFYCFWAGLGIVFRPLVWETDLIVFCRSWGLFDCCFGSGRLAMRGVLGTRG